MMTKTSLLQAEFEFYKNHREHYSQFGQDILALYLTEFKTDGYFVEFGASDGIENSNTLLLEREYNWTGILAEPQSSYLPALYDNRTCHTDSRCVYTESNSVIEFQESSTSGHSGIKEFFPWDTGIRSYYVPTVSLGDLLDGYEVPEHIDYMSVDTEGSEFEILNDYDFSRTFGLITVEHNHHQENRKKLFDLMTRKGYKRIFESVSNVDDYYIPA